MVGMRMYRYLYPRQDIIDVKYICRDHLPQRTQLSLQYRSVRSCINETISCQLQIRLGYAENDSILGLADDPHSAAHAQSSSRDQFEILRHL